MKKLYRKGTVHPSPPAISDHLSFLPATILTLAAALSPEDREVLAYLISCSSCNFSSNRRTPTHNHKTTTGGVGGGGGSDHPASFNCSCFRCYTSYWARWDTSPNRQLIHEIIDAFEDGLLVQSKKEKGKKERRRRGGGASSGGGSGSEELKQSEVRKEEISGGGEMAAVAEECGGVHENDERDEMEIEMENGSVRKFLSFIGEKIWGVWNQRF